ncbi:MAG: DUF1223 domain-containing protein [Rhodobacteraceae bacterium]|nr:MAG: DUF1223 domain-containing protein [Paracoccaceae bacterium]
MRFGLGLRVVLCAVFGLALPVQAQHSPVVVELFTSQGCAACPPADRILETLADREDVIALALHVDYWDYIGWTDSFGHAQFSERQKDYARARGRASVFTPQMIVGGLDEVKGSSQPQVMGAINHHLGRRAVGPHVELTLSGAPGSEMHIEARAPDGLEFATDVFLIRYKDAETVEIMAGENAGRSAVYRNIVTSWRSLGTWDGIGRFQHSIATDGPEAVVVIFQEQGHGPIVAAARRR